MDMLVVIPVRDWNKKPYLLRLNIRGPNISNTNEYRKTIMGKHRANIIKTSIANDPSESKKFSSLSTSCGGGTLGSGK